MQNSLKPIFSGLVVYLDDQIRKIGYRKSFATGEGLIFSGKRLNFYGKRNFG
jgi:hypothetical protein